jgi:hypothetical protein
MNLKLYRHQISFFLTAIISITFGCQQASFKKKQDNLQPVKTLVEQTIQNMAYDVRAEGPYALIGYFEHSPRFSMITNGQLIFPDYKTAEQVITKQWATSIAKFSLRWKQVKVEPLTSEFAHVEASYTDSTTLNTGRKIFRQGYFTGLAHLTEKGWRIRTAHWSDNNTSNPIAYNFSR